MFGSVFLDWFEVFYLILVDEIPNDGVVHVQIAKDLATGDQLSDCVVSNLYVGLVCSQRNGAQ
jgi:hypothetical protein